MGAKTRSVPLTLAAAATMVVWSPLTAQSASSAAPRVPPRMSPHACSLLTDAEVNTLVSRRQHATAPADTIALANGSGCYYHGGAQIILFSGPKSQSDFEALLKRFNREKEPRHPVSGVGDRAYIMFPEPRDEYEGKAAILVTRAGQHTLGVFLHARKGAANSFSAILCRGNQSELSARERKECPKILADTGETAESLQPSAVELTRIALARLR